MYYCQFQLILEMALPLISSKCGTFLIIVTSVFLLLPTPAIIAMVTCNCVIIPVVIRSVGEFTV